MTRQREFTMITGCQSIYYLWDFNAICCIFCRITPYIIFKAIVGRVYSLMYSINSRAFCPRTPHGADGWTGNSMCMRINNYSLNHFICHFKTPLLLFELVSLYWTKRTTLWFHMTQSGKHPLGGHQPGMTCSWPNSH